MCGRFARYSAPDLLATAFDATPAEPAPPPSYNIAPGARVLAVRTAEDSRQILSPLHWGLVPRWSRERKIAFSTFNARAETVAEKPAFRESFRHRRCLIPADGFFEWQTSGRIKQPYFIRHRDGQPLAFAGLWDGWQDPQTGERLLSCSILVTDANALMRTLHPRMPVILSAADQAIWLDPEVRDPCQLQALLRPCDPAILTAYPVDRRVNSAHEDGPTLIDPLPEPDRLL